MGVQLDISLDEMARRHARLKQAMAASGLKALLVFGTANSNGNASIYAAGGFRYLSDFYTLTLYAVLVVSPDHPCSMFVPSELCEDRGRRVSWVKDVRHSLDYASDVVRACRERGITDGKVGVVSLGSIPVPLYLELRERLPAVEFVDATQTLLSIRHFKTKEERDLIAKSAWINDQAFQALLHELRPGLREFEVVNLLQTRQRALGADGIFNLISSGRFSAGTQGRPRLYHASSREIADGDSLTLEVSCSYGGYWSQLVRVVSVGPADPDALRIQEAAMTTLNKATGRLRVGMRVNEYFGAMAEEAGRLGYKLITPTGHLCGMDLAEARIDNRTNIALEPNMAFICHPHLVEGTGRWLLWGHTFLMTENGPASVHADEETGFYAV